MPVGPVEFIKNIEEWRPTKNRWFAEKLAEEKNKYHPQTTIDEEVKKTEPHVENCACDECLDRHEEAEEYDEATGFND